MRVKTFHLKGGINKVVLNNKEMSVNSMIQVYVCYTRFSTSQSYLSPAVSFLLELKTMHFNIKKLLNCRYSFKVLELTN